MSTAHRPVFDSGRHIGPRFGRWMTAFIVVGLAWRALRYLLAFPVWGDEAFVAWNLLTRDFAGMTRPLEYSEFVPLLFMWVQLGVCRLAGFSEHALRLVPFLCGAGALLLFADFCRRTMRTPATAAAVGIFAVSYYLVRHGAEIKPYAGDAFAAALLLNLGWRVHERPSRGRWAALLIVAPTAMWWSYPSAFVIGGVGLLLLVDAWRRPWGWAWPALGAYGLLIGASFASMYLLYARPQRQAGEWIAHTETWRGSFPPVLRPLELPGWLLEVHTGNLVAHPVGGKKGGSTATLLLVLAGIASTWRRSRPVMIVLLGPAALNFIAAAMRAYPYGTSARVSLHLAPAICWLAGEGLAAALAFLSRRGTAAGGGPAPGAGTTGQAVSMRLFGVVAGVILLIGLGGIVRDVLQPYKTTADRENRRVLRELVAQLLPWDRLIVFNTPDPSNRWGHPLHPYGGYGARFRFYVSILSPVPVEWAPEPANVTLQEDGRVWLVAHDYDISPLPRDRLGAYAEALKESLGGRGVKVDHAEYVLDPHERIIIYRLRVER